MAFLRAAAAADLPPGTIKDFHIGGKEVALANVNGTFHAISNVCLHRGGPLGQGLLENHVINCPWHGWQFDVTTGQAIQNLTVGVACYPVEVRDGEVFVDVGQG
jgi:nitrite reductase (NADH) small subunit